MRRINIKKGSRMVQKSFLTKEQFVKFLREKKLHGVLWIADQVWFLNVGTALTVQGYRFACAGKSRAGNHIVI